MNTLVRWPPPYVEENLAALNDWEVRARRGPLLSDSGKLKVLAQLKHGCLGECVEGVGWEGWWGWWWWWWWW